MPKKKTLMKRCRKYGVGKEIGGAIYLHRDYEHLYGKIVEAAKQFLPDGFEYHIVKHNLKNDAMSFICSDDFDVADEPSVGLSVIVHTDGTTRARRQAHDPEIYHHKWMFVQDDYTGFDVEQSRARSESWLLLGEFDHRKIGKKSYWQQNVIPKLRDKK